MAGDDEVGNGVSCPNLNRAVVPSEDDTVTGLHNSHGHAVVRDVDRVLGRGVVGGSDS